MFHPVYDLCQAQAFFQVWGYSRVAMKAGITPFVVFGGSPLPAMANDDEIRRR